MKKLTVRRLEVKLKSGRTFAVELPDDAIKPEEANEIYDELVKIARMVREWTKP